MTARVYKAAERAEVCNGGGCWWCVSGIGEEGKRNWRKLELGLDRMLQRDGNEDRDSESRWWPLAGSGSGSPRSCFPVGPFLGCLSGNKSHDNDGNPTKMTDDSRAAFFPSLNVPKKPSSILARVELAVPEIWGKAPVLVSCYAMQLARGHLKLLVESLKLFFFPRSWPAWPIWLLLVGTWSQWP